MNKEQTENVLPKGSEVDTDTGEIKLPPGMEMVSDGTLTPEHDWTANPEIYGEMQIIKVVPVRRGKLIENTRLMIVTGTDGKTAVWESAGLKDLFDIAKPGGKIYIKYKGLMELDGGRNPMKQFVTAYDDRGERHVPAE